MENDRGERYKFYRKDTRSSKRHKDEVVRSHIGVRRGNETDFKTVYKYFEKIKAKTGVAVRIPFFNWRVYRADQKARDKVYRLNNPRK